MPEVKQFPYIYSSMYGADYINASQRVAELMCKRKAGKAGVVLPDLFWRSDAAYCKYYQLQIKHASSLLTVYDADVILSVLDQMPSVYSVAGKWLHPYFQKLQAAASLVDVREAVEPAPVTSFGAKQPKRKNLGI